MTMLRFTAFTVNLHGIKTFNKEIGLSIFCVKQVNIYIGLKKRFTCFIIPCTFCSSRQGLVVSCLLMSSEWRQIMKSLSAGIALVLSSCSTLFVDLLLVAQ